MSGAKRGLPYDFRVVERANTVIHRLPRQNGDDSLEAARSVIGGNAWIYLSSVEAILDEIQKQPVVIGLNWYEDFNYPEKHPFLRARREFFFIGEQLDLIEGQDPLGSWHLAACGYHRSRQKREWIRLQNCWGHDYPLVWMPVETIRYLWDRDELEASIAA